MTWTVIPLFIMSALVLTIRCSNGSPSYLATVAAAGGFARYERAHRTRLAAIFIPKFPQLPAEVVHHILPFWADVGGR